MKNFALFAPLAKADAATRMVYGYFDETPDRAREVCDYATAKPAFMAWSSELEKMSGGKSLGNVRGQHSNIAAGKLVEITYDDEAKRIGFAAHIVDDNEWRKVDQGVYTGFSPGGKYAKKWADGHLTRYTPLVQELSIVDVPCNPSATFTMIKADGAEEERGFVIDKAYEPGNDATKARAEDLAKAVGPDAKAKDYVAVARAELIAENAAEQLAKAAGEDDAPVAEPGQPAIDVEAVLATADAALAKANAARADTPADTGPFADMAKAGAAVMLIAKSTRENDELAKGLYTVERTACLLERIGEIAQSVCWEANSEADGSPLPQMAVDLLGKVKDFLIAMVTEEVAEMIATMPAMTLTMIEPVSEEMALAAAIVDLVKADSDALEKAGARNSKRDASMIQSMHDNAVTLGATCAPMKKAEELEADNSRLAKALDDTLPRVEQLAATIDQLVTERAADKDSLAKALTEIDMLKAQPLPPKGAVFEVSRGNDNGLGGTAPGAPEEIPLLQRAQQRRLER